MPKFAYLAATACLALAPLAPAQAQSDEAADLVARGVAACTDLSNITDWAPQLETVEAHELHLAGSSGVISSIEPNLIFTVAGGEPPLGVIFHPYDPQCEFVIEGITLDDADAALVASGWEPVMAGDQQVGLVREVGPVMRDGAVVLSGLPRSRQATPGQRRQTASLRATNTGIFAYTRLESAETALQMPDTGEQPEPGVRPSERLARQALRNLADQDCGGAPCGPATAEDLAGMAPLFAFDPHVEYAYGVFAATAEVCAEGDLTEVLEESYILADYHPRRIAAHRAARELVKAELLPLARASTCNYDLLVLVGGFVQQLRRTNEQVRARRPNP